MSWLALVPTVRSFSTPETYVELYSELQNIWATHLCSLIPWPTLQNPYVISAAVPTRYMAGRKPRAGRFRLYWMGP